MGSTSNNSNQSLMLLAVAGWLAISVFGGAWLLTYAATPGAVGDVAKVWPEESRVVPDPARANLVFLAHPRCPCSRASLVELAQIMSRCRNLVTAHVLFIKSPQLPEEWEVTDLWHSAVAIPGVRVLADEGGVEARRFGGATSGHVLLYGTDGNLLYSGGVTVARGHCGDNAGRSSVIGLLAEGQAQRTACCVYGCPLFPAQSKDEQE